MLSSLSIKNFKCWKDTGKIHLAPITLFFGTNSSGKSSLSQFLMLLKQTVESSDRKIVLYPGGRNSALEMGSYLNMVYHRDEHSDISFYYRWDLNQSLNIQDSKSRDTFLGNEIEFKATVGYNENRIVLKKMRYNIIQDENSQLSIAMEQKKDANASYCITSAPYQLIRKKGRAWNVGAPLRFYGFPSEVVAYYQNADFVQELNLYHEKMFKSIFYLGPLRIKAERLYTWSGIDPESVGYAGEHTIAALLAAKDRKISLGYRRLNYKFHELIARKLKELGLIEDFRVQEISKDRKEYEVKVKTNSSLDYVDLPDAGFGISQVLPVLTQCFHAPANSILIMEQPELHLHPSAQSALADVFIDVINSREKNANRNIQLLIETHSEHFLRRLQRRIAEDKIASQRVSAYCTSIEKSKARLDRLSIDEYGNIKNWPKNFFGDEMADITSQAKASLMKRRMRNSTEK